MFLSLDKFIINVLKCGPIPRHIAFILDGNRRFGVKHSIKNKVAYQSGSKSTKSIINHCITLGLKQVTIYLFSIENFNRSKEEVDVLLEDIIPTDFGKVLNGEYDFLAKGVRFRIIGNKSLLPEKLQQLSKELEERSASNDKLILNIALSYTSRDEITHAVRTVAKQLQDGQVKTDDVDADYIQKHLYLPEDVDCIVRTSGELRFSDFVLWQIENAQILFYDTHWPSFKLLGFIKLIVDYQKCILTVAKN